MKPILSIILICCLFGCVETENEGSKTDRETFTEDISGKLFIIGGGRRGDALVKRMIEEAGLHEDGFGIILPMSSAEPDSAIFYAMKQFTVYGLNNVVGMDFSEHSPTNSQLDSIAKARLIYISGGDQNRFMKSIESTDLKKQIQSAYKNGSMIAGTSAGAALMSEKMITGDEKRYPDYSATFRNLESDNIVFAEGLGLFPEAIIDQHFVKRSRYNRLLSAVIEFPEYKSIGIDESTALLISSGKAEVVGESQIIVFSNPDSQMNLLENKLGAEGIVLDIYLPGQKFNL